MGWLGGFRHESEVSMGFRNVADTKVSRKAGLSTVYHNRSMASVVAEIDVAYA